MAKKEETKDVVKGTSKKETKDVVYVEVVSGTILGHKKGEKFDISRDQFEAYGEEYLKETKKEKTKKEETEEETEDEETSE